MDCLKKYYKVRASSLLESVVALSIISVCLYIAVIVYSAVFSPKTSARVYGSHNKVYEAFFMMHIKPDSLMEKYDDADTWLIDEEVEGNRKKITIHYKDSIQEYPVKSFYVSN